MRSSAVAVASAGGGADHGVPGRLGEQEVNLQLTSRASDGSKAVVAASAETSLMFPTRVLVCSSEKVWARWRLPRRGGWRQLES